MSPKSDEKAHTPESGNFDPVEFLRAEVSKEKSLLKLKKETIFLDSNNLSDSIGVFPGGVSICIRNGSSVRIYKADLMGGDDKRRTLEIYIEEGDFVNDAEMVRPNESDSTLVEVSPVRLLSLVNAVRIQRSFTTKRP